MKLTFRPLARTALAALMAAALCTAAGAQDAGAAPAEADGQAAGAESAAGAAAPTPFTVDPAAVTALTEAFPTVFSQVFPAGAFNEITVSLIGENFVLAEGTAATASVEIKATSAADIPSVTQKGKALKIVQKKKPKGSRVCLVTLTLPQNQPVTDFSLTLSGGKAILEPVAAANIAISAGSGTVVAQGLSAGKGLALSVDGGMLGVVKSSSPALTASVGKGTLSLKAAGAQALDISVKKGTADIALSEPFTKTSSVAVDSGSVTIYPPETTVFYGTVKRGTGRYRSDFPSDSDGAELKGKIGKGTLFVLRSQQ